MKYSVETIRSFGQQVFEKAGLSKEDAAISIDSFIQSDLRGIRTHGTTHLIGYCDRLENGTVNRSPEIEITQTSASTLVVDCRHTVGMASAMHIMERCIEEAKKSGSCFATAKHGSHYGFGGYYPMKAAENGMIGFCFANGPSMTAPWGGADPVLSTNPFSVAMPTEKNPMFVLDMATSLVAKGKISLALKEGRDIPLGWALDKDGNPTTDAAAANVGVLLPMGGYKGYGIGTMITLLCYALADAAFDRDLPRVWDKDWLTKEMNIGFFMGAIDISKFTPLDEFKKRADFVIDFLKSTRLAPGFDEILVAGEKEYRLTQQGLAEGIDLSEATLRDFRELADRYKVDYPF